MLYKPIKIDLVALKNNVGVLNMKQLTIFNIMLDDFIEYKIYEMNCPNSSIRYVEVGFTYFIDNYLQNENNLNFWYNNRNSLYILKKGDYYKVRKLLSNIQNTEMRIVRGSAQLSHYVSSLDYRLSCYLMLLYNMDFSNCYYNNTFNLITKDLYLSE